jgi:hypothetical protein
MMLHLLKGNAPWFRAKRYGFGAGLPNRWQGWVLLLSYVATLVGADQLSKSPDPDLRVAAFTIFVLATAIFLFIIHKRTEGGWKWRWGGPE